MLYLSNLYIPTGHIQACAPPPSPYNKHTGSDDNNGQQGTESGR